MTEDCRECRGVCGEDMVYIGREQVPQCGGRIAMSGCAQVCRAIGRFAAVICRCCLGSCCGSGELNAVALTVPWSFVVLAGWLLVGLPDDEC